MKKAFTLLELVAVIMVVALLSIALLPRFSDNRVREAADQILSHIRYTQHLALIDDRFNPNDPEWWHKRWLIGFWQCTDGGWYYVVGRDLDNGGGIGNDEAAINPFDKKRLFTSNACVLDENQSGEILITEKYGINDIEFSDECGDNSYIAFDNTGRPYKSTLGTEEYDLITDKCEIVFKLADANFTVTIEPETGYTRLTEIKY